MDLIQRTDWLVLDIVVEHEDQLYSNHLRRCCSSVTKAATPNGRGQPRKSISEMQ